jgi:inosine/xanthosine triphosphatase
MRIVVGSENPVKLTATHQAFTKFYDDVEVLPAAVTSGVNPFPMTQQEILKGATTRVEAAWASLSTADFAVGIEGGVHRLNDRVLIQGFAAVKQASVIGLGASVAFEVSHTLLAFLDPASDESKSTIDSMFNRKQLFQNEGLVGVLTKNRLTRTQILRDAVIAAFPRFVAPQHFVEG